MGVFVLACVVMDNFVVAKTMIFSLQLIRPTGHRELP